jgi:hypothetical protein
LVGLPVGEEQAEAEAPDAEQDGPPPGDASVPSPASASASSPAHGCRRRLLRSCQSQLLLLPPPLRPQLLASRIGIGFMELDAEGEARELLPGWLARWPFSVSRGCRSPHLTSPSFPIPCGWGGVGVGSRDATREQRQQNARGAEQPSVGQASDSTGALSATCPPAALN